MTIKAKTREMIKEAGIDVFGNYVRINGELFPLPLVKGNSKLGENVWHSSTLPTNKEFTFEKDGETVTACGTCPITCDKCYGTKGRYQMASVMYPVMMRTRLLREYPEIYFLLVRIQIIAEGIDFLRIHAVGDFINGEATGFYNVLKGLPNVTAWTYTKREISGEIAMLDSLANCNVVKSIIAGCGFNFGHIDYIIATYNELKRRGENVYICRCGIDSNQHCSDCDGCSSHEYVLFIEHSTDYKAKKDPLYPEIVKLINSQKNQ